MHMVAPRTGAPEITIAEDQLEYSPLVAAVYRDENGTVMLLTRWSLTDEDRARAAGLPLDVYRDLQRAGVARGGEDLYLGVLTGGRQLQPLSLQIGVSGWEPKESE